MPFVSFKCYLFSSIKPFLAIRCWYNVRLPSYNLLEYFMLFCQQLDHPNFSHCMEAVLCIIRGWRFFSIGRPNFSYIHSIEFFLW